MLNISRLSFCIFSATLGVATLIACGGKVVFSDDGNGGSGGASSTTTQSGSSKAVSSTKVASSSKNGGVVNSTPSGGLPSCQTSTAHILSKYSACGIDVLPPAPPTCTPELQVELDIIAACYEAAPCSAITGADSQAQESLQMCVSAANQSSSVGGSGT